MCRWLAYSGPPVFLDRLILEPENSLISQSLHALEGRSTTNGDGFGIGWYGERDEPGVYRDVRPAWNDDNLESLAHQIRAGHFFAHVRATTGTAISQENCHPFRYGRWLFMHNGQIGGYETIRRDLVLQIAPELFRYLRGTTDSEVFFLLMLSNGAEADPGAAFARTVAQIEAIISDHGLATGIHMTAALTDGATIHALRYASDGAPPSLYYACGAAPERADGKPSKSTGNSILILSEPLDDAREQWEAVPPGHLLIAGDGATAMVPFTPGTA